MSQYKISHISKSFGELHVLDDISQSFEAASVTAILGPSGCGKTTLFNILSGIVPADLGDIGEFAAANFSYAFQDPRLLPWLSAEDNMRFALSAFRDDAVKNARIQQFLADSGLEKFRTKKPAALSGGMKRRLSLARAFACPSDVLLLDESFSSVDLKLKIELMDLFSQLWEEEKRTTIFITHDIKEALYLADTIILLSSRPARILKNFVLDTPRSRRLFSATEYHAIEDEILKMILR